MKLLFDENLSPSLAKYFNGTFLTSMHVSEINLANENDVDVWEYAKHNNFSIVSKDKDFNHMVSLFGFPPKVIWIRRGNCSTQEIKFLINSHSEIIKSFLDDSTNGILTIF